MAITAAVVSAVVSIGVAIGTSVHQANMAEKQRDAEKAALEKNLASKAARDYKQAVRTTQIASAGTVRAMNEFRDADRSLKAGKKSRRRSQAYTRVDNSRPLPTRNVGTPSARAS